VFLITTAAIGCGALLAAAITLRRNNSNAILIPQTPKPPLIPPGEYQLTGCMDGITMILDGTYFARIDGIRLPEGDTFGEVGFELLDRLRGQYIRVEPLRSEYNIDYVHATEEAGADLAHVLIMYGAAEPEGPLPTAQPAHFV